MQTVGPLAGLSRFEKGLNMDVDVIEYPGTFFSRGGPQYSTQVLNDASAESHRCGEKKSTQVWAVKAFTNKLTRGNQNLNPTGMESIQDDLTLSGIQVACENIGAESMTEFQ